MNLPDALGNSKKREFRLLSRFQSLLLLCGWQPRTLVIVILVLIINKHYRYSKRRMWSEVLCQFTISTADIFNCYTFKNVGKAWTKIVETDIGTERIKEFQKGSES